MIRQKTFYLNGTMLSINSGQTITAENILSAWHTGLDKKWATTVAAKQRNRKNKLEGTTFLSQKNMFDVPRMYPANKETPGTCVAT